MSSTKYILSVIIVAYKSRLEIESCLASLPRVIDIGNIEIVLVDNFPADGIGEFVRCEFPWVRYIACPENQGFGKANNLGYLNSVGEIILYLNPDTISTVGALTACSHALLENCDIGLISPKLILLDGTIDLACRRSIPSLWDGFCRAAGLARLYPNVALFSGYNLTHLPPDETYDVGAINGAFMMTRREVLEKVGLFDENFFMYGDDLDLCIRVAKAGYRIVYDGRCSITHLKGVSVAKDFDRMAPAIFDANRDVYLKHFNPRKSILVRWKYIVAFELWKRIALLRARLSGHRRVRPL